MDTIYTKPKLRDRLKRKIKAGKKGGRRGQWSAQKAQILAKKYEKKGGGYRGGSESPETGGSNWTVPAWQAVDSSQSAESALPSKVWQMLSEKQQNRVKKATIKTDRNQQTYADWPGAVYVAMKAAGMTDEDATEVRKVRLRRFARRLGIKSTGSLKRNALVRAIQEVELDSETKEKTSNPKPCRLQPTPASQAAPRGDLNTLTKQELYEKAQAGDILGRSTMTKAELVKALSN